MVRKKKRRYFQITCFCTAYEFPHRLGGGKCSGTQWAESYYEVIKKECSYCNCHVDNECEVAQGIENIHQCEAYQSFLYHKVTAPHLPESVDTFMEEVSLQHYYDLYP